MDKLEYDLKLVKNVMLSYIQKKYGILPPDQTVKGVEIVNGHIKAEEQLEKVQHNVPSGITVGVSSTVTTAVGVTPDQTRLKLLKIQQQQQQQQKPHQQQQSRTRQENANKMKIYKCGSCTFQSKELGHVQFHMRHHTNKREPKKRILNQSAAKALTPVPQQKKRLYKCQVCSECFDSRINCLDHIHKDHNQPTQSISNGKRETEDSRPVTNMNVDKNPQGSNKGTVYTNMMLNDNVPPKGSANVEQEEGTENAEEGEEDTAVPEQEVADQETPGSFEKDVDEDDANVENKMGDLGI
eukprot:XP_003245952.2 PREDICTED: histone H4 transcription factor-like [Acyrthosiphon pisum]